MYKLLFLLCFPVAAFAQDTKEFTIKGKLNAFKDPVEWVYISYAGPQGRKKDSVKPNGDSYELKGVITEPNPVNIWVGYPSQLKNNIKKDYYSLFLEPGSIKIASTD